MLLFHMNQYSKTNLTRSGARWFGLILLGLTSATAATEPIDPVRFQRATLTVANLDDSIAYYRDLLGFTVSSRSAYDTPALRQIFNLPAGAVPELVLLDAGEQQPRSLALVGAAGIQIDRDENRRGAPALLFNTAQMDAIHAAMKAAGREILLPPTPLNDFSGKPFGREAAYLDPDGVRVILFEGINHHD